MNGILTIFILFQIESCLPRHFPIVEVDGTWQMNGELHPDKCRKYSDSDNDNPWYKLKWLDESNVLPDAPNDNCLQSIQSDLWTVLQSLKLENDVCWKTSIGNYSLS